MTRDGSSSVRPDLVLLIAYAYPPCPEPGATRPSHFAKYLRRLGYNVKVISAFENPSRDEVVFVPNRYRVADRRSLRGVSEMFLRKFLFPSDDAMLWAADAAQAAEPLVRQHRSTAVFSTFPPLNSHVVAWLLKRRFGVRWVADFRDPLEGSPARQLANAKLPFGAIPNIVDSRIQSIIFRNADGVIANTDTVLHRWQAEQPAIAGKLWHIANGFDAEEIATAAPIPIRRQRVMAHVGSIYTGRHPVPLLHSMERLIGNGRLDPERFLLHLVGALDWSNVPDHEVFPRLTALGCLHATGKVVPQAEARQVMRQADYLLLLDVMVAGAGQQIPSKIFDYIPMGRPILALTTRNSPTDRVLAGSGVPYVCLYPESSAEAVDTAVLDLLSRPSEPVRPSDSFLNTYDAERRTRMLADLLEGAAPTSAQRR